MEEMKMVKCGNYLNGIFYGHIISINGVSRHRGGSNKYTGWLDIDQWKIRNLMTFKNCLMKAAFYTTYKNQFDFVFGAENLSYRDIGGGFIVVKVTEQGRIQAEKYILEEK